MEAIEFFKNIGMFMMVVGGVSIAFVFFVLCIALVIAFVNWVVE